MANVKSAVGETQLKARRTSLGKKTNEELINIILRKDKTERSLNCKINELNNNIINKADNIDIYKFQVDTLMKNLDVYKNTLAEREDRIVALSDKTNSLKKLLTIISSISGIAIIALILLLI